MSTELPEIKRGVPIPAPGRGRFTGATAVLRAMEPGDSIEVPIWKLESYRTLARTAGIVITTRQLGEASATIWRVS